MIECPDCGGSMFPYEDDDAYLNTNVPQGFYCPGCGYDSNDPDDPNEDAEICPSCGGRDDNHRSGCAEDDATWY